MSFSLTDFPVNEESVWRGIEPEYILKFVKEKYHSGKLYDFTIGVKGKRLTANRLLISLFSPFFESLFKNKNNTDDPFQIDFVNPFSVKSLVNYTFTGRLYLYPDNVCDILYASVKLRFEVAKKYCFDYLLQNVCGTRSFVIHQTAVNERKDHLRSLSIKCFAKYFHEIAASDEITSISFDQLITCIEEAGRHRLCESDIHEAMVRWTMHDVKHRAQHFSELFQHTRFHKLPWKFIAKMKREPLIRNNILCNMLLCDAAVNRYKTNMSYERTKTVVALYRTRPEANVLAHFDATSATLNILPDLPRKRIDGSAVIMNEYLYFIGGIDVHSEDVECRMLVKTVWRMNLRAKNMQWEEVCPVSAERHSMGAVAWNNCIAVVGGCHTNFKSVTATGEYYCESRNEWKDLPLMKKPRAYLSLLACEDTMYAIGGFDGKEPICSVECLHRDEDQWRISIPMQTQRRGASAVYYNECIYVMGGLERINIHRSVEKLDFSSNVWVNIIGTNTGRWAACAFVMKGNIYVVGGIDDLDNAVDNFEKFSIKDQKWSCHPNSFTTSEKDNAPAP